MLAALSTFTLIDSLNVFSISFIIFIYTGLDSVVLSPNVNVTFIDSNSIVESTNCISAQNPVTANVDGPPNVNDTLSGFVTVLTNEPVESTPEFPSLNKPLS